MSEVTYDQVFGDNADTSAIATEGIIETEPAPTVIDTDSEENYLSNPSSLAFLQERVDEGMSEEFVRSALSTAAQIAALDHKRDAFAYYGANLIAQFDEGEMWKIYGHSSFNEWCSSDDTKMGRSTAYAYLTASKLLDVLPFGDINFEKQFCEDHGLPYELVYDAEGNVDATATLQKSSPTMGSGENRIRFTDFKKLAAAYKGKKISAAIASDLAADSMLMTEDAFNDKLRKYTGSKVDADGKLFDVGIRGGVHFPVNLSFPDRAKAEMLILLEKIEEGFDFNQAVYDEDGGSEHVATKSLKFHLLPDGTVLQTIHLAE